VGQLPCLDFRMHARRLLTCGKFRAGGFGLPKKAKGARLGLLRDARDRIQITLRTAALHLSGNKVEKLGVMQCRATTTRPIMYMYVCRGLTSWMVPRVMHEN